MPFRLLPILLFLFPLLLPAQTTSPAREYTTRLIGFYNVENLYDTLDAPDVDDAEFLPDGPKQWGTQRYFRKLDRLAQVIGAMGRDLHPNGLAIIGLAEVENRKVVEDLAAHPTLAERKYQVVHEDSPDRRGVDVALIYDPAAFQVYAHKAYRLTMPSRPDLRTRDQLLVSGLLDGDTLHVIVAHWPSRRGGEKRSMPNRQAAGDLGRHIADSLFARNASARIVYMGDLNDDPVNRSMTHHLKATGDRKQATGTRFFNPMHAPYQKGIGTLAWRDSWNLFDQIVISPALLATGTDRYGYYGVRIYNEAYLRQQEGNFAGYPLRTFVGDGYQDGFSDHFPVYLILVKELQSP
jgi:endonuclease/exonuclease/phosphatase family metal-dependent hydrolase